mmetsp:Transcript_56272/g.138065  ORF Transcript_56272/g.138065 Transcript_56272/m.138065 type:complete len:875 (+) Transcript_56272:3098-5722(+)
MTTAAAPPAPVEKFRKDYKAPDFVINKVDLTFKIGDDSTQVLSSMQVDLRDGGDAKAPLRLDAEALKLNKIMIDGKELASDAYSWASEDVLELKGPLPASFKLETDVTIKPQDNTQLSGLYKSSGMYCSQCEAEGFRRITPFQDRPDVMASYSVRIEASKASCPVLLSNGNLVKSGELDGGRHFAEWTDPFPKPSYLFALVAGDLGSIKDTYKTASGRNVQLEIFSEHANVDQLDWAMQSLKDSMKWDEERFGLEYDLDVYNIVAVNDFNMGAMENKGLNVFNTACVLAKPETATDADYGRVQGVIAHEYFHNWTGNRVTCRDWFQLTLKEGLTVFRDQQFSMDMTSEAVKRIEDVRSLRAAQFPQDSGPMAHPIRPEAYVAMDNFYTATVYLKGAEVIGMYQTLLGREGFRKGMDLYFKRHDGTAVTCDDFRAAMADANGADLAQFERWYTQSGTPTVKVAAKYDADKKTYTLEMEQSCKPTPGQDKKEPFHIPVRVGLLGKDGSDLVEERVLELKETKQTFVFEGVSEQPVPSILRGFSAPVKVVLAQTDEDLAFLMANDKDSFNRWEAGQKLLGKYVLQNANGKPTPLPAMLIEAVKKTLTDSDVDPSLKAYALTLPSLSTLAEEMDVVDPDGLVAGFKHVKKSIAEALKAELLEVYKANVLPASPFRQDGEAVGMRRIKNTCLDYLSALSDEASTALAMEQLKANACMTDVVAATTALASHPDKAVREEAYKIFYDKHAKGNDLILCKWFGIQALADIDGALSQVDALLSHPDFSMTNPNKCRSVIGTFGANMPHFHNKDGSGYEWLGDRILEVDKINNQVAARLTGSFSTFRRYDERRQKLMKAQLERLLASEGLSKDAYEVASRSIKG